VRAFLISSVAFACATGCNFESANPGPVELNVCSVQADCSDAAECRDGMCMAQSTEVPLSIALEVTPKKTSAAEEALPQLLGPISIEGPIERDFPLNAAILVSGLVRDGSKKLASAISFAPTFVPTKVIAGIPLKTITVMTTAGAARPDDDYQVQLLAGVQYRMLVRPAEAGYVPHHLLITPEPELRVDVNYATIATEQRWFAIDGGPSLGQLQVSASDRRSGETVSSTATVRNGKAQLSFPPSVEDFRIDIRASQTYAPKELDATAGTPCDSDTPAYPAFSIDAKQLGIDPDGIAQISLPQLPRRIRYEGRVELCPEDLQDPKQLGNLPITLRSHKLGLEQELAQEQEQVSGLVASYNATTNATFHTESRELRFCVEVMPGEYDIVVTPPSSAECSLFAERRLIKAPANGATATGVLLELPPPRYLHGKLQTMEMGIEPLKGGSIDAVALGRGSEPDDLGRITRFNRSRQTTTNARGEFKLLLDLGSYDIVIKPPAGSGFPWQVRYDVEVDADSDPTPMTLGMVWPISVDGRLRRPGEPGKTGIDGATIEAYALVPDGEDDDRRRAISIGKATASSDGAFTILLPPSTKKHW
jgi:hypothetical protein